MLHVDENIGGRQDQKNHNLRTRMLAVGLMLVLGCFATAGYFSATTTTTTAHTRGVSLPNVNGMVSNLQHFPYAAITNKTPYDTYIPKEGYYSRTHGLEVWYGNLNCQGDLITESIASGDTWTASSRGYCLVTEIKARISLPDGSRLECAHYKSSGTSYSIYSILMKGDDACCVLSSHQTPQKCR